jgi:hypothetical protein
LRWEYAGDRNPVSYRSLEELGIDPAALKWEEMQKEENAARSAEEIAPASAKGNRHGALSLDDAKRGLALTFNVPAEAIEITIRG